VYGFSVGQQYNAQIPAAHFMNRRPATDAAILLNDFSHSISDRALNSFELDLCAIRALPHHLEVPDKLHS